MSDKMWEVTIKHARTCILVSKLYISRGPNHTIFLNPICQVVKAVINGDVFTGKDLATLNKVSLYHCMITLVFLFKNYADTKFGL